MLSSEREPIAYRVTALSDIRRVVRVKVQKRKKRLTREVALETGQDVIKKKKKRKREEEERRCSIIAETGNILTSDRTWRLNKILGIIVPGSARTGAINSLA